MTNVDTPSDPIDALRARLQLLEDERAILRTLYQYGHAMDYGPDAEWLACFTDDGVWDVRMRREAAASFCCRGHDELRASLAGQTAHRSPALYAKHLLVEPRIDVSGNEATVESYFLRVEPRDAEPSRIVASGRYRDQMVRCDDGRWRFRLRIAEIDDM